jgi:hypothetical protein
VTRGPAGVGVTGGENTSRTASVAGGQEGGQESSASREEANMRACSRLSTDEGGVSRFRDLDVELAPGLAVPPAQPLHSAPFLPTEGSFWVGAPTTWRGDAPHPAPRRQIFVTVRGEYQVTAGDGTVQRFPAGSVLVLEDTTGTGHSTRITSGEDCIVFAVGLPETTE